MYREKLLPYAVAIAAIAPSTALASSHMDAPLITLDDAANTTDVYAFVSEDNGQKYLTTALSVYPFEDPGIGPNKYNFDDNVLYTINLSLGDDLRRRGARRSRTTSTSRRASRTSRPSCSRTPVSSATSTTLRRT